MSFTVFFWQSRFDILLIKSKEMNKLVFKILIQIILYYFKVFLDKN